MSPTGAENSNRRKKAVPKKSEAEGSSINQQRSTKRSPKVAKAVPSIGTNRRGRGLRCHGDDIVRGCIKRRRLDHSVYNITIDEEDYPLIRRGPEEYEVCDLNKDQCHIYLVFHCWYWGRRGAAEFGNWGKGGGGGPGFNRWDCISF